MIYKTGARIDTNNCQKLSEDLAKILENGEDVILDLKETNYISSAGFENVLLIREKDKGK